MITLYLLTGRIEIRITFAGDENSCRSQIAGAAAGGLFSDTGHEFNSAVREPAGEVDSWLWRC